MNFKINSSPLFTIIFKLKNDNFKIRDFSPLIERVLAGVQWPEISRDQKIPGPKNPGILKPEKSRNKKSRDCECIKIPGFLYESWDIPAGFFPLFL